MKLEVGMYVRTTYGRIYKIEKVVAKKVYISCNPLELQWQDEIFVYSKSGMECETAILKASHNIIDLIEVGDYVNGSKVIFVNDTFTYASVEVETTGGAICEIIPKKDIKIIVTKEQFEAIKYEVK